MGWRLPPNLPTLAGRKAPLHHRDAGMLYGIGKKLAGRMDDYISKTRPIVNCTGVGTLGSLRAGC